MTMNFHLDAPLFLRGFSNQYYADVPNGWLSIKSMWNGEATYLLDNGRLTINNNCYLILNNQQPYTIRIESKEVVESFCIFFPAKWAGDVLRNFMTPENVLLDEVIGETAVSFYNILHRHDQLVTPHLQALRQNNQPDQIDKIWQTEKLYQLLAAMLQVQHQVHHEITKLPASRKSTRTELYRRLHIGREFMHAMLQQPISLTEIAQTAALSPYYFLRSFKQLFGQTPHVYLTTQRIKQAQHLLSDTDMPITDICFSIGFQSLGSFSTLFHRRVGQSPTQFRQSVRKRST